MCPVDAIRTVDDLGESYARYAEFNALYAASQPEPLVRRPPRPTLPPLELGGRLRVAIVGAGPAGLYTAERLLTAHGVDGGVDVDVFDRLPTPWGLIRAGVAPDHQATKGAADGFRWTERREGFRYRLGIEVGRDIAHQQLAEHFHAVVYAYGAVADRRLGIPGEDLPGVHSAAEFANWYNAHPDYADRRFDLSGDRAVVVGNGNVALDVARILTADPVTLATTDIADHALDALRVSNIREVVVLARRGAAEAAYTSPELEALGRLTGVDVAIDPASTRVDAEHFAQLGTAARLKLQIAAELAARKTSGAGRRIVLQYLRSPVELVGAEHVTGLRIARNELGAGTDGVPRAEPTAEIETVDTSLVLRSIGNRGIAIPGVPFDDRHGVVPNQEGRVVDEGGQTIRGVYTVGWIKRGPSGVIGSNKKCAAETVDHLLADARSGRLPRPARDQRSLDYLLAQGQPNLIDQHAWSLIDRHERDAGAEMGRPRAKIADIDHLVRVASGTGKVVAIPGH